MTPPDQVSSGAGLFALGEKPPKARPGFSKTQVVMPVLIQETSRGQHYGSFLMLGTPQAGPAPALPGAHLEETEGRQPAGAALLILTAEDVQPLVAISKLVGLWGEKTDWSHICLWNQMSRGDPRSLQQCRLQGEVCGYPRWS